MQMVNPSPAFAETPHVPSLFASGEVVEGVRPYIRLDRVDRTHAQSLVSSIGVNPAAAMTSRVLAGRSLIQYFVTSMPLVIADFFTLWALLFLTTAVIERVFDFSSGSITRNTSLIASFLLLPIAQLAGLYPAIGTSAAVEFRQLVRASATALCIFAVIGIIQAKSDPNWKVVWEASEYRLWSCFIISTLATMLVVVPLMPASRFVARAISRRCRWWGAPVLIYADSALVGGQLFSRLMATQERGLRPVAVLLDKDKYWATGEELSSQGIRCLPVEDVLDCALEAKATWVLVAKPKVAAADEAWNEDNEVDSILHAIPNRVVLSSVGGFDCGMWDQTQTIGNSCGLLLSNSRHCYSTLFVKRFIDFTVASLICLLASPLLIGIAIAIRLSSPGPILFGQRRIGYGGVGFTAWKFRSMVPDAEKVLHECLESNEEYKREWEQTHKLKNDPRVTWVGRFLRTTSFDELPQLWNILCGEMSLVGPRPIVDSPNYDESYIRDYRREFAAYVSVRPGLTGMWQVTCRNSGVYEMRIYWDMYYIRNWSVWLDLYIILRTVRTVLLREGSA